MSRSPIKINIRRHKKQLKLKNISLMYHKNRLSFFENIDR